MKAIARLKIELSYFGVVFKGGGGGGLKKLWK